MARHSVFAWLSWFPPSCIRPDVGRFHACISILTISDRMSAPPARFRKSSMNVIFRRSPLGFSMNHHVGLLCSIISMVFCASAIERRALSLFGIYPLGPPVQLLPIAATLNPWHGGDAHKMSALMRTASMMLISISGCSFGSLSIVIVLCPLPCAILLNDFVPLNISIVLMPFCRFLVISAKTPPHSPRPAR